MRERTKDAIAETSTHRDTWYRAYVAWLGGAVCSERGKMKVRNAEACAVI